MQTTTGIETKRRKPPASLHAYKVCKLKHEPLPYFHHFTEDEASKKMKKSTKGKALDAITELDAFKVFIDENIIEFVSILYYSL